MVDITDPNLQEQVPVEQAEINLEETPTIEGTSTTLAKPIWNDSTLVDRYTDSLFSKEEIEFAALETPKTDIDSIIKQMQKASKIKAPKAADDKEPAIADTSAMSTMDQAFDVLRGVADGAEEGVKNTINTVVELGVEAGKFTNLLDENVESENYKIHTDLIQAPETMAGNVAKSLNQFLVGFVGPGKLALLAKGAGKAGILTNLSRGALADFFAYDEHTERLSNVIQNVPALQNPVTEYLAGDENDTALESKLKLAAEGAGLGAAVGMFVKGVKLIKGVRPQGQAVGSMASEIGEIAGDEAKKTFLDKAATTLAKSRDTLIEYRSQALLSSPATQLRNILSNVGIVGNSVLERGIARGYSKLFQKGAGVEKGETLALVNGYFSSLADGVADASRALKSGKSIYGSTKVDWVDAISAEAVGLDKKNILGKGVDVLGAMIRIPGKGLAAGDEFFKTINYNAQLRAIATRTGLQKGLTGDALKAEVQSIIRNPPQSIADDALNFARVNTFTNDLGELAGKVSDLRREFPTIKLAVPFFNTLANITKYSLERFPVTAPLFKQFRDDIAAGGVKKALAIGKIGAGSVYTSMALGLYANGVLTGKGPSWKQSRERSERKQRQLVGWQPNSIKIGDTYVDYKRFDPLGQILALAADTFEAMDNLSEDDEQTQMELMSSLFLTMGESILSDTWAEDLTELMDIVASEDPGKLERYSERFVGSLVPNVARTSTKLMDNHIRVSHDYVSEIKKRIPGLSEEVPIRYDTFGREETYKNTGLGSLFNPFITSEDAGTEWEKYFIENDIVVSYPSSAQWFNGVHISLKEKPEIFNRMIQLSGEVRLPKYQNLPMRDYLASVVGGANEDSALFHSMKPGKGGGQETFVKKVVSDYRKEAREKLMIEYPELQQEALEKRTEKADQTVGLKEIKKVLKRRKK